MKRFSEAVNYTLVSQNYSHDSFMWRSNISQLGFTRFPGILILKIYLRKGCRPVYSEVLVRFDPVDARWTRLKNLSTNARPRCRNIQASLANFQIPNN